MGDVLADAPRGPKTRLMTLETQFSLGLEKGKIAIFNNIGPAMPSFLKKGRDGFGWWPEAWTSGTSEFNLGTYMLGKEGRYLRVCDNSNSRITKTNNKI